MGDFIWCCYKKNRDVGYQISEAYHWSNFELKVKIISLEKDSTINEMSSPINKIFLVKYLIRIRRVLTKVKVMAN